MARSAERSRNPWHLLPMAARRRTIGNLFHGSYDELESYEYGCRMTRDVLKRRGTRDTFFPDGAETNYAVDLHNPPMPHLVRATFPNHVVGACETSWMSEKFHQRYHGIFAKQLAKVGKLRLIRSNVRAVVGIRSDIKSNSNGALKSSDLSRSGSKLTFKDVVERLEHDCVKNAWDPVVEEEIEFFHKVSDGDTKRHFFKAAKFVSVLATLFINRVDSLVEESKEVLKELQRGERRAVRKPKDDGLTIVSLGLSDRQPLTSAPRISKSDECGRDVLLLDRPALVAAKDLGRSPFLNVFCTFSSNASLELTYPESRMVILTPTGSQIRDTSDKVIAKKLLELRGTSCEPGFEEDDEERLAARGGLTLANDALGDRQDSSPWMSIEETMPFTNRLKSQSSFIAGMGHCFQDTLQDNLTGPCNFCFKHCSLSAERLLDAQFCPPGLDDYWFSLPVMRREAKSLVNAWRLEETVNEGDGVTESCLLRMSEDFSGLFAKADEQLDLSLEDTLMETQALNGRDDEDEENCPHLQAYVENMKMKLDQESEGSWETYAKKIFHVIPKDTNSSFEEVCANWEHLDTREVCRIFETTLRMTDPPDDATGSNKYKGKLTLKVKREKNQPHNSLEVSVHEAAQVEFFYDPPEPAPTRRPKKSHRASRH
ncbi:unnamed protein product [Notodromas monacha]|uniref:Uncharacterized protein n=1 Tax=Notodromas monacha TaxID=399045 RepID=A0A7R9BKC7_9CRUS|nr:unnamed protein product [Notodromas monacha]CAG0917092.1 unnamed protein product [Notodromas monacha]